MNWKLPLKVALFAALASVVSSMLHIQTEKTYAEYVQEILDGDEIEQIGTKGAEQVRTNSGLSEIQFNTRAYASTLSGCLRAGMMGWLASGDPQLEWPITKTDVLPLVQRFLEPCLDKADKMVENAQQ